MEAALHDGHWLALVLPEEELALCCFLAALSPAAGAQELGQSYNDAGAYVKNELRLRPFHKRAKPEPVVIVIYHTNDIHGAIAGTAGNPEKHIAPSGGAASLA